MPRRERQRRAGRPARRLHGTQASWQREELSLAFSEDDAKTWTKPVVIARQPGGGLSYPFVFERRPGELWIIHSISHQNLLQPEGSGFRAEVVLHVSRQWTEFAAGDVRRTPKTLQSGLRWQPGSALNTATAAPRRGNRCVRVRHSQCSSAALSYCNEQGTLPTNRPEVSR